MERENGFHPLDQQEKIDKIARKIACMLAEKHISVNILGLIKEYLLSYLFVYAKPLKNGSGFIHSGFLPANGWGNGHEQCVMQTAKEIAEVLNGSGITVAELSELSDNISLYLAAGGREE